jgi:hypothetical protein
VDTFVTPTLEKRRLKFREMHYKSQRVEKPRLEEKLMRVAAPLMCTIILSCAC